MKKILNIISVLAVLCIIAGPIAAKATTTSAQDLLGTLQSQIEALKAKISTLTSQLESLKKAQGEVKDAAKDVKTTLQLIRNLKEGMSGDDIKTLQELLATDSDIYPEKLITGYYGKLTAKAVKRLQKKLCLEEVGQVGPQTMRRINELLEEGAGKSYGGVGGHVPAGLLRAPGIQKKLCGTTTPATTTPDTIAPIISDIEAKNISSSTAKINWETNELANSKVWYSNATTVVTATPTAMVSNAIFVKEHSMTLTGLMATTTYYYVVVSTDQAGNTATATQKSLITLGN